MSDESTALVLFDTMRPADHPLNKQQSTTPETKLEPEQPQQQAKEPTPSDKPIEQVMYADTMYAESEIALISDERLDATPEQIKAARADYRAELHKIELPIPLAKSVTEKFTTAMRMPLSDADYAAKASRFDADMVNRFGAEGAREKLADVRALLAKVSPEVVDGFVEAGLNVDVEVVAELAEHARRLRGRGRL